MDDLREIFGAIQNKLSDLFSRVNQLEATPVVLSSGGGGAPIDAQYLTLAFNAGLTQERRLDFSANFTTTDGGANADYDVDLSNTAVVAGAYGSATQVGTFTVDAKGRLTAAANVAISGVPPSAHNLLSASHGDTLADNVVDGDIIVGNATPRWARLAINVPAANVRNVLGIDNGELRPSWKAALDATNPVAITVNAAANPGTSLIFSHRDHAHASPATWTPSVHNILDATYHGDTVTQAVTRGSLIYGNATPKWDELTVGANGTVLYSNGTDPSWQTLASAGILGGSGASPQVAYWNGANTVAGDAGFEYNAVTDSIDLDGKIYINTVQTVYNAHAGGVFTGSLFYGTGGTSLLNSYATAGDYNTGCGIGALYSNTIGQENTAIGYNAMYTNTAGIWNTGIGCFALEDNLTGNQNAALGYKALNDNTSGSQNVGIGNEALRYITSSSYGVGIGSAAGALTSSGAALTSVANSIFIGYGTRANANSETNQIVIGDQAIGKGSNTTVIGNSSTTASYIEGSTYTDDVYIPDGGQFGISGNELLTVNAAGTFAFSGISGITIENADWIGNGAATARLVFDSSGATDYAYFSDCNVGIGTASPGAKLQIGESTDTGTLLRLAEADFDIVRSTSQPGGFYTATPANGVFYIDSSSGTVRQRILLNADSSTTGSNIFGVAGSEDSGSTWTTGLVVTQAGNVGIGTTSPAGKTTIDQSSTTAAIPVLELDQADDSEEMINFIVAATSAGNPVDTATAVGAAYARLRVAVNGTFKYIQLYDA